MNTKYLLFVLILISACKPNPQKVASNNIISEAAYELYDLKSYAHLDSLKIIAYIESEEGKKTNLLNPNLFLYRDVQDKIKIAFEKEKKWYTWEVFDASNYSYYATIKLENFDDKGSHELIIQSRYGIAPQSTMGSEYYGDTEIWDLDRIHPYFTIEHYNYSDDMGRNGDNSFSEECKLVINIQPKLIIINQAVSTNELQENDKCFADNKFPKYLRLIDNEIVESDKD